jgi:very-short-patch-repair endonuclease
MSVRDQLEYAIAYLISEEKAYEVAAVCCRYGLPEQGEEEETPWNGKFRYVERRLKSKSVPDLVSLGIRIVEDYSEKEAFAAEVDTLKEALRLEAGSRCISELTRRDLARALDQVGFCKLGGQRSVVALLRIAAPALDLTSGAELEMSLADEILRHMEQKEEWDCEHLFDRVGAYAWSDDRFLRLMEEVVHPLSRTGEEQVEWLAVINQHIARDGFTLDLGEQISGYPTYKARPVARGGVDGRPKNLIFGSTGEKPEIVLDDAVNNDVRIVRHADLCLIFDEPFPDGVFTWEHLVAWWARREGLPEATREAEERLYRRLAASVRTSNSPPEYLLFRTYYSLLGTHSPRLPALIPQVYLHFDPATVRLYGGERLVRQRMDFLLLLGHGIRVVLEIDGKHHYADTAGRASPRRYGEMVAEDRRLRLAGYEVFRFGGHELQGESGEQLVKTFSTSLFERCRVPV